jgi:hypothetical protein
MFSYLSPEERVPANHPLRPIRLMVDDALKALSPAFIDSARKVVASIALTGVIYGSQ